MLLKIEALAVTDVPSPLVSCLFCQGSHSGSPLSCGHDRLCELKHVKLPFGFLLRTSAIQTSLIALGLSSGDQ